jgi:uncharacterized protein involved in exopolysaccharide biosynthesis
VETPTPQPTPQLEYLQYIGLVLRKRKWMMIKVGLAAFLAVQFFGYLVTPVWEGTALLLVERTTKQNVSVFREVDMPITGQSTGGNPALELIPLLSGWNMTYDVVRKFRLDELTREKRYNPATLRDVIKNAMVDLVYGPIHLITGSSEPNWVDKAAEEFIEDSIDIEEEEEKTSVVNLTVYGETPKLATDIANGMADLLEQRTQDFSRRKAALVYEVVARQVVEAQENLIKAQQAVARFQETKDLYGPEENRRLLVQKIDQLRTDLEATRRLQGELASSVIGRQSSNQFLQANIALSPVVRQIEATLVNLNAKRSALLLEKTAAHPEVQVIDTEIARNQQQLKDALEAEGAMLTVRETELQKNIADLESSARAMPEKEMELARLQQVAAINRTVFDALRSRLEQLAMDKQSMSNEYTIRVLDRAYVPAGRDQDWPLWWLNIVAGLFLALAFGVGGAFVIEYWNRPVLAARDVQQFSGLRFLGRFPELDERNS